MKIPFYIFLILLLISNTLFAYPAGGFVFFNQREIDDFASNHPVLTKVEGNICIGDDCNDFFGKSDITNLNGLLQITSIEGNFNISHVANNSLANLQGLNNHKYIGGDFTIDDVVSLRGLDELKKIDGTLILYYNQELTDLSGLQSLRYIGGSLSVFGNEILKSLSGINNSGLNHINFIGEIWLSMEMIFYRI